MSSDGKVEEGTESPADKEGRKKERRGEVTSLRSRVRRRASRCQIYRRVLDGACPRLLISLVASMPAVYRLELRSDLLVTNSPFYDGTRRIDASVEAV